MRPAIFAFNGHEKCYMKCVLIILFHYTLQFDCLSISLTTITSNIDYNNQHLYLQISWTTHTLVSTNIMNSTHLYFIVYFYGILFSIYTFWLILRVHLLLIVYIQLFFYIYNILFITIFTCFFVKKNYAFYCVPFKFYFS